MPTPAMGSHSGGFTASSFHRGRSRGGAPQHTGGFFGNLIGDVRDAIFGLPRGFEETFTHPIRTLENVGKSYAYTYGPLFHGDFGQFAHRVEEHPLGPILDLATIATLGAGAAVSVPAKFGATEGLVGRLARMGSDEARAFELTTPGGTVERKLLARNPATRFQQKIGQHALNKLPKGTPYLGEFSRAVRVGHHRDVEVPAYEHLVQAHDADKAIIQLGKGKTGELRKAATVLIANGIHEPAEYQHFLAEMASRGTKVEDRMVEVLDNPRLREMVQNPDKRIVNAVVHLRELAEKDMNLKLEGEGRRLAEAGLSPEEIDTRLAELRADMMDRPFLVQRLMSGARYVSYPELMQRRGRLGQAIRGLEGRIARTEGKLDRRVQKMTPAERGTDKATRKLNAEAIKSSEVRARLRRESAGLEGLRGQIERVADDLDRVSSNRVSTEGLTQDDFARYGLSPRAYDEGARIKLMGRIYDQHVALVQKYEKALAASQGVLEEEARALRIAERQAENVTRRREAQQARLATLHEMQRQLDNLREERAKLAATREKLADELPGFRGGKSVPELRAELSKGGKIEPFYMPHRPTVGKLYPALKTGRGLSPVREHLLYESRGLNAAMGRLALDPQLLRAEYLNTVRQKFAVDAHEYLLKIGKRHPRNEPVPKGWRIVRESPSENIRTLQEDVELRQNLLELIDDGENPFVLPEGSMTAGAAEKGGDFVIVPQQTVKEVVGEYSRSSSFLRKVFSKPFDVWRSIILGFRPAFLVNNVVGNHFLWAITFAGPAGLHAYISAVLETKAFRPVRRLLDDEEIPASFRRAILEKHFPDQLHGTFGESQATGSRRFMSGIMPQTMAAAETLPRMAGVIRELRRSDAVKARVQSMPAETREWWRAADEELTVNRELRDDISQTVNRSLGDYLHLTDVERRYVRAAMPFYAWYRAIFTVTMRMPLHTPGRTRALAALGEIGIEKNRDELGDVPSFLLGSISLSHSELDKIPFLSVDQKRQGILTMSGLNPFETFEQEMSGIGGLLHGQPGSPGMRELAGGLNPFIQAGIEQVTGEKVFTGAPLGETGPGGLVGALGNVVTQLPQVQILFPPKAGDKSLYDKTWQQYFWSSMGLPVRQMNPDTAKFLKQLETGELKETTIFTKPKAGG